VAIKDSHWYNKLLPNLAEHACTESTSNVSPHSGNGTPNLVPKINDTYCFRPETAIFRHMAHCKNVSAVTRHVRALVFNECPAKDIDTNLAITDPV
jgi:hypothetical protein